jgi:uncharacterized protein YdeI (YjbR/CyaY-like superfamily)
MPRTPDLQKPRFFPTAAAFAAWLRKNGSTATSLIVGYYKVGSGKRSMTWPESVDEALCAGWIDGVRKRIDEDAYQIRFTPRRATSIWSTVNIARAKALIAEGRMQAAGLAAFKRRTDRKSNVYAYEQAQHGALTTDETRRFKRNKAAWAAFESLSPSRRRVLVYWVVSAKQAATRERRLAKLMHSCATKEVLMP